MHRTSAAERLINSYLLGDLAEEEMQAVEVRIMTDRAWHELLGTGEDELIENYLDHNLSSHERERFEGYFLSTPQRQERLRFARALNRYTIGHAPAAAALPTLEDAPVSFFRPARMESVFLRPQQTFSKLPVAVTMLAAVSGLALLLLSRSIPSQHPADLSATLSDPANQTQASNRTASGRTGSDSQRPVEIDPGLFREMSQIAVVELAANATQGLLKLRLVEIAGEVFQPVLQTAEGTEIAALEPLRAVSLPDGRSVTVQLPASRLSANMIYRLQLNAIDQQGHAEEIGRYYFKVVRR